MLENTSRMVSDVGNQGSLFQCPSCHLKLEENYLDGLCPACIWASLSDDIPDGPRPTPIGVANPGLLQIPGYHVLEEISRGGMGIVYRAQQLNPLREVALKMLLPHQVGSAELRERFRTEILAICSLEHQSILPVYQAGEYDGMPFFAMKYASRGSLALRASEYYGNFREIATLITGMADAVQFAHERGVLHRDLKPGNILFDQAGRVYLSDFGLAKFAIGDRELTRTADIFGTPSYLAPEVAAHSARQATTASDIYSLGAILYELLARRLPFEAEDLPVLLRKIAEEEPPPLPGCVPRDLGVICLKCLAKEPQRRFASTRELAEDLRRWLAGVPISARPVSYAERAWRWARRNPSYGAILGMFLLLLLGGGVTLWQSDHAVRAAQSTARNAQLDAQQNLRANLLAEVHAIGAARKMGQRSEAIEILARAARIGPSVELRNEAAAALARPDLREILRFRAQVGEAGSSIVFSSDLQSYVAPEPAGGFSHRATRNQALLAGFPGSLEKPARWFVLSPDDRHVAALLNDYTLEVWALDERSPKLRWKGSVDQPPVAGFHPDGKTVAGFVPDAGLFLQGLDGTARRSLVSSKARAIYLRFDPTGERLAVVRDPGGVELWRCTGTPRLLWTHPLQKTVPWVAWSPDGKDIAVAADDGKGVRVISARSGQIRLIYSQHLLYPRQFEFAPIGHSIVSIGQDWVLRFWDARTGADLVTGVGRHRVMQFSRDGRSLTTSPKDGELSVLELAPERVFREFASTPTAFRTNSHGLALSADGRLLMAATPMPRLYDAWRGEEVANLDFVKSERVRNAFFDSTGQAILYSRSGQGVFRRSIFLDSDPAAGKLAARWGAETLLIRNQNATILSALDSGRTWVNSAGDTLQLKQRQNPAHALPVSDPGIPRGPAAGENDRWAAVIDSVRDSIIVKDFKSGRVISTLTAHNPSHVWFSPDGEWLVAGIEGGYRTWRTANWQPGASWNARLDSGDPAEVAFSGDGKFIAARHERETFRLLSFPDCRELVTLKPPIALPVQSACLSRDGNRLWLLDSGYRIFEWNLAELRSELARLGLNW